MAADTVQDVKKKKKKKEATMQVAPNAVVPCDPTVIYFTKQCNCITPPAREAIATRVVQSREAIASHCRCERAACSRGSDASEGASAAGASWEQKKKKNAPRPRHCQRSLQGPGSALVRKRKPKLNAAFFLCSFFSSFPLYPATLSMSPPHITFLVSTQCRFFFFFAFRVFSPTV